MRRLALISVATGTLGLVGWGTAGAGVLRVPSEYPTIQEALTAAVSGDSVLVAPGTYTNCDGGPCTPNVAVLKAGVILLSEGGAEVTVLRVDAPGGGLAVVHGSGIVTGGALLKGFTITGTAAGYRGVVVMSCRDVCVEECRFVNLAPGVSVGAGMKASGSTVVVRSCAFRSCVATMEGAGYDGVGGSSIVEGCLFESCDGGGSVLVGLSWTSATVRDCVFRNNTRNTALTVLEMPRAEVVRNVFEGNSSVINSAALVVNNADGSTLVCGNVFVGNDATQFRSVMSCNGSGEIRGNVFYGNASELESATLFDGAGPGVANTLANNIFMANTGGPAYRVQSTQPQASCNLFWANPGGDYVGYVPAPTDLFVDPLFCDPEGGDFRLAANSPCLPENSGGCGLIGAFGQGCGGVAVGRSSWGSIKARYR
jgi:hypothetical protein